MTRGNMSIEHEGYDIINTHGGLTRQGFLACLFRLLKSTQFRKNAVFHQKCVCICIYEALQQRIENEQET